MHNGTFITLEGGEGAGKSTLIQSLQKKLEEAGHEVIVTREPGGSSLGKEIRSWLLEKGRDLDRWTELLLFLADRSQHLKEVIRPALDAGKVVICDRFNDSTIAYQGFGRGLDIPKVQELCELVVGQTVPDLTLYLDIPPEIGLQRAHRERGEQDRLESEELAFHIALRKGFHWLAEQEPHRIQTLDAAKTKEQVFDEAWNYVKSILR